LIYLRIIHECETAIREKERSKDFKRWRTTAFEEVPEPDSIGPQKSLLHHHLFGQNKIYLMSVY
jgi:hypothetical protein